ncbi:hypothetical protein VTN49DRAFT_2318 [Thermomyces lanuginosus]|uniref:uncharacterized protein n=1 Tax=Thermomyces lanuginosus TaxID=5541 RepID=UPI0037421B54
MPLSTSRLDTLVRVENDMPQTCTPLRGKKHFIASRFGIHQLRLKLWLSLWLRSPNLGHDAKEIPVETMTKHICQDSFLPQAESRQSRNLHRPDSSARAPSLRDELCHPHRDDVPVSSRLGETFHRSLLARATRPSAAVARRGFVSSAIRRADPVQDLYLRELRAYKPSPVKPGDAEAHVQKFSAPQPPPSPEEANIANELKEYENQAVEVEGQAAAGEEPIKEESWFEEEEEEAAAAAH